MKTIPFDLAKAKTPDNPNGLEVMDKGGRKVRIICTDVDKRNGRSVVAVIKYPYEEVVATFFKDGIYDSYKGSDDDNLILVSPDPKHIEVWGFIYKNVFNEWIPCALSFPNEEQAEIYAQSLSKEYKVIKFHEYDE